MMKECDLVLKGGTTSGVIYPPAIYRIGAQYRLRSVGGASAGAMAATVAAAAEYGRQMSPGRDDMEGFEAVRDLSEELGKDLVDYLQPSPALAPFFDAFVDVLKARNEDKNVSWVKLARLVGKRLRPFRRGPFRNLGVVTAGGAGAGYLLLGGPGAALGLVLGAGGGSIAFVIRVIRTLMKEMKAHDYGLVPGTTQPGRDADGKLGVSDWLADRIDQIAGRWQDGPPDRPLTIGDLRNVRGEGDAPCIELATMTTDLTSRRPFTLPLEMPGLYFFDPDEFKRILPARVVDYMVDAGDGAPQDGPDGKRLYPMPVGDAFPVVLTARMSLSFPILLQAVPLYRKDTEGTAAGRWVRCLFSDGGITSNLPVHFFDSWLPGRPTFAISLDDFQEDRHTEDQRIEFEQGIRPRTKLPVVMDTGSIGKFVSSIFFTAKDWQDKLQSEVPGMYERVVTVRLQPHQGGLNLAMSSAVIGELQGYGDQAGQALVDTFDFDENRYRRALSLLKELEAVLPDVDKKVNHLGAGPNNSTFAELAAQHRSEAYPNDPPWPEEAFVPALQDLAALGAKIADSNAPVSKAKTPDHDARLRLVASPGLSVGTGPSGGVGT